MSTDLQLAAIEAQRFIDENKGDLGIFTLRKAFEMGYIAARVGRKPVAHRMKQSGRWHYFDDSDPFPTDDMDPLYE